ncbi:endonuclease/exonuclease/phosphatase family protein [Lutimaribacter marinistellae]|uniref:Endonuclease/exonuclease/phosphatase family protein n=1 Tax=Lutimaribacter marinistellae TaxID=1820329 RepID=A0ABV7TCW5_9RHOB
MKWLACLLLFWPALMSAESIRVATYNTELGGEGPGLMLRDIERGAAKVEAIVQVIAKVQPDILALQGIDWDHHGKGLAALADRLAAAGVSYPHRYAAQPNSGLDSGVDLDGDGRLGGPGDAHGWGAYTGRRGIAVLSRFPFAEGGRSFSDVLWQDLPGAELPRYSNGSPFPSEAAQAAQRLSTTAHWLLPVDTPQGPLWLMTFQATPPVFDGPEDLNGLRNRDEIRLWQVLLDGKLGDAPTSRFVIAGGANLDPWDSDGRNEAIRALLADDRLQDPEPRSSGGAEAGSQGHRGNDALDTVEWNGVGRLRVDYVLPSADWTVTGSGVYWPARDAPGHATALDASRHRLVWVDLRAD